MTVAAASSSQAERQSSHRRLFSAVVVVGVMSVVARLAFVARDLVIASQFGTAEKLDAYLLAFALPSFAVAVISISFNAALIPTFIQVWQQKGRVASQRLISNAICLTSGILVGCTVALAAVAPWLLPFLGSHLTGAGISLANRLTIILLPSLVVSGLSTMWGAVLNAQDRYAVPAIAPACNALIPLVLLILSNPETRVLALTYGTVLGYVGEAVVVGVALHGTGLSLKPAWFGLDEDTRSVLRQYAPMVAGSVVMSASPLVNQALAGMLGPSTISSLSYGTKLVSLVLGIGALSLSTAALPHFSRKVATGDAAGVRSTLRVLTMLIVVGSIPLVVAVIASSRLLISLLFQRGAFTAHDTALVSSIQQAYALQIPSYLLGMLLVRLVSSLKSNQILFWGALINLSVNIILGYVMAKAFGAVGIALTTTAISMISCAFIAWMLRRRLVAWEKEIAGQSGGIIQ